jgi:hypothetical protein
MGLSKTSFGHSRSKPPPPQSHISLEIISPERYHLKAGIQRCRRKLIQEEQQAAHSAMAL